MKRKVELDEINNALNYLIKNKSVTGEILTLDSGQSLGWANSKSKVFSRLSDRKLSTHCFI